MFVSHVCLSVCLSTGVSITDDALDLTIQGPLRHVQTLSTWTSLYIDLKGPVPARVGTQAVDILLGSFLVCTSFQAEYIRVEFLAAGSNYKIRFVFASLHTIDFGRLTIAIQTVFFS